MIFLWQVLRLWELLILICLVNRILLVKGISLGEGAGFIVLVKDKERAKYGKIIGGMITSDAYHITAPKPTGEGAAQIAKQLVEKSWN